MNRSLTILILCMLCFCACRKDRSSGGVSKLSPDYQKAVSFLFKQNDSAFYYFNKVTTNSRDSLQVAMAYNQMAVIQSDAGDYFGSQENLSISLKYLDTGEKKDYKCLSSDYNELGLTSISLKNFEVAIGFFEQAIHYSSEPERQLPFFNNKALAYQEKGDYPRALQIYQQIIRQATRPKTYARILNNMATTKWLAQPRYNAAPELLKALRIRYEEKDLWGQNSSYTHLASYYTRSQPDSALFYAGQMYTIARQIKSPDDQLEALAHLIRLSQPLAAKNYFIRYQVLSDSLKTARNAAKNQFALIRYNVERNKAENLRLQKDNAENKYQLVVRNILLVAGFILLAIVTVSGFAWYRRYKRRKEQEKQEAILETWRKASKDVHDSLSNDIYLLMKRIKHDTVLDRDWLKQHTEFVYQRSRNISYEILADINDESFPERLGELLKSFGTDDTKVSLVLNNAAFWQHVAIRNKLELRLILQELMVNMQKHSEAENVIIRFQISRNERLIIYTDDGTGIADGTLHQNGLTNAENRIKAIGGGITFGSNDGSGLKVRLNFPIT